MRLAFLSLAVVTTLTSQTFASDAYPEVIQRVLELPEPPACTLCHATDDGGARTVTKPFGSGLMDLGLLGTRPGELEDFLAIYVEDGVDTDQDLVSDTDELIVGTDPNVYEGEGCITTTLLLERAQYGCALSQRKQSPGWFAFVLALCVAGLGRRRARR